MNEQKATVCNLAIDTTVLKIGAMKSPEIKEILKGIRMNEEDLSESRIALNLDDIYEFCILKELDDPDHDVIESLTRSMMKELPNYEEYKQKYGWE